MIVLHLEDNEIHRGNLARHLGVKNDRLGGHDYVTTDMVAQAEDDLRNGRVKALVLDLGLDNNWTIQHHLSQILKDAVERPVAWEAPPDFRAYKIAVLARRHHVPFAVLTNFADQLGLPIPQALDGLKAAFGADAAFTKDETGLEECAVWVRKTAP